MNFAPMLNAARIRGHFKTQPTCAQNFPCTCEFYRDGERIGKRNGKTQMPLLSSRKAERRINKRRERVELLAEIDAQIDEEFENEFIRDIHDEDLVDELCMISDGWVE